jgi:hypothetical protein
MITHGQYAQWKHRKMIRTLALCFFVICVGLIMGFGCGITKIYYWSISNEGISMMLSIAGHIIRLGQTP